MCDILILDKDSHSSIIVLLHSEVGKKGLQFLLSHEKFYKLVNSYLFMFIWFDVSTSCFQ